MATAIAQGASSANRTHIGFFGRMNAGKSSLLNAFCNQEYAIVSDTAGTTTDVVKKPMEIHGIGACVLLDTAGYDDIGELGEKRVEASMRAADQTDLAVLVIGMKPDAVDEKWMQLFKDRGIPTVCAISNLDALDSEEVYAAAAEIEKKWKLPVIACSSVTKEGIDDLRKVLIGFVSGNTVKRTVTTGLVNKGDVVLLVMPQDPQAPEGRLIQPEVQTIRDVLDHHAIVIGIQLEEMECTLAALKEPPALIITDSQVFKEVYALKPEKSRLTSFSVLFAGLKGDINYFAESAAAIESLTENSRVLIAECCTHVPMEEDIGRIKIPALLKKRIGAGLTIDIKAGTDFPADASEYDLIIQCGSCMFNRRYVMNRIAKAKESNVPMTNYGIAIAYLKGILSHVTLPREVQ